MQGANSSSVTRADGPVLLWSDRKPKCDRQLFSYSDTRIAMTFVTAEAIFILVFIFLSFGLLKGSFLHLWLGKWQWGWWGIGM